MPGTHTSVKAITPAPALWHTLSAEGPPRAPTHITGCSRQSRENHITGHILQVRNIRHLWFGSKKSPLRTRILKMGPQNCAVPLGGD